MNIRVLSIVLPLASVVAAPAFGRPDRAPPPSGIVVHLFGPNSVTSNVLPSGSAKNAPAQSSAGGSILRQMFITGDPNRKPGAGFARGRAGTGG